jgi:hypothetical protein
VSEDDGIEPRTVATLALSQERTNLTSILKELAGHNWVAVNLSVKAFFLLSFNKDGDFRIESTEQFRVLYTLRILLKTNSNSARLSTNPNMPSSKGWFS